MSRPVDAEYVNAELAKLALAIGVLFLFIIWELGTLSIRIEALEYVHCVEHAGVEAERVCKPPRESVFERGGKDAVSNDEGRATRGGL